MRPKVMKDMLHAERNLLCKLGEFMFVNKSYEAFYKTWRTDARTHSRTDGHWAFNNLLSRGYRLAGDKNWNIFYSVASKSPNLGPMKLKHIGFLALISESDSAFYAYFMGFYCVLKFCLFIKTIVLRYVLTVISTTDTYLFLFMPGGT